MEALAVVGLAGNICQFLDFSCRVLDNVNKISQSEVDRSKEAQELYHVTEKLQDLCTNLSNSRKDVQGQSVTMKPAQDPLVEIAQGCEAVAAELLSKLDSMKPKDPTSKRSNFMAAFKTTWQDRTVKDMQARLQTYRSQLMLHVQVMQRYVFSQFSDSNLCLVLLATNGTISIPY